MTLAGWREEAILKSHDRSAFDCGEPALNDYLRLHARQNHERGASKTILAISTDGAERVLGYYSLSPVSVAFAQVPELLSRGLGRYEVPGFRMGRLAVSLDAQGMGLGGQLLMSAARRCIRASIEVGGTILLIDAKNERAANWYKSYGAVPLVNSDLSLALSLNSIARSLKDADKL